MNATHGNLNPSNILFDASEHAHISEAGFPSLFQASQAQPRAVNERINFSPAYASPELWLGQSPTFASDIYSLACIVDEMISGKALFEGKTIEELQASHFAPPNLASNLPQSWKILLKKALAQRPEDRFESTDEFVSALLKANIDDYHFIKKGENYQGETIIVPIGLKPPEGPQSEGSVKEGMAKPADWKIAEDKNKHAAVDPLSDAKPVNAASVEIAAKNDKKPDLVKPNKKKTKLGLTALIALLLIILGVIAYQLGKRMPKQELLKVVVTATTTNTEALPTKAEPTATEAELEVGSTRIRLMDGMEQVYVPAGDFIMGSEDGYDNEKPVRKVYLDSYWIDKFEVTNGHYQACISAGKCTELIVDESHTRSSYYINAKHDDYPVMYVGWYQAKEYCQWAGGDLPTEAQWEKAARGVDGRTFPWGNEAADKSKARYNINWNVGPVAVGSKPDGASPYGAEDMAGNAWEWVSDWWAIEYDKTDVTNPQGPATGDAKVLRGGSWLNVYSMIRTAFRVDVLSAEGRDGVGFRCVSSP